MNIVFVSHSAFHPSMVVGSHQLSRVYARSGHRILHLSLPFSLAHVIKLGKPQMFSRMAAATRGLVEREPNLLEWVPWSLVPWDIAKQLSRGCQHNFTVPQAIRVRSALRRAKMDRVDIALIDDPRMYGIESILDAHRTVYRATDLYAELRGDPAITGAERRLLRGPIDGIFATSERVAEHLRHLTGGRDVKVFENGFDEAHFRQPRDPDQSLAPITRPRVVYIGAIDQRFDFESVAGFAELRPSVQVLIYGPVSIPMGNPLPPNLRMMGSISYDRVPAVLQHCEVAILPLKDTPANHGRSPMKFYEYRASGATTVAFASETLRSRRSDPKLLLYRKDDAESLTEAIDRAIRRDTETTNQEPAADDEMPSWESIGRRMLESIANLDSPDRRLSGD